MYCSAENCEKQNECHRHYLNRPESNDKPYEDFCDLYNITYTNKDLVKQHLCGVNEHFAMFIQKNT